MTTTEEWAASLSASDCKTLIARCLEDHDLEGAVAALHILAVKDPDAAELIMTVVEMAGRGRRGSGTTQEGGRDG